MLKKRGLVLALCSAAACFAVSCGESNSSDLPCGGDCPNGLVCNEARNVCEVVDPCANQCASNETCNPVTKLCEPAPLVDACNNACVAPQTCNPVTKLCENPVDACSNSCTAPLKCNETTKTCVACLGNEDCTAGQNGQCQSDGTCKYDSEPEPCNGGCTAPQKCNVTANVCVDCLTNEDCTAGQNGQCQPNGTCSYDSDSDPCNGACQAPLKCKETTKTCVDCLTNEDCTAGLNGQCLADGSCKYDTPSKCTEGCQKGQACDEDSGKCVMIQGCGIEYNTCKNDDDCESSVADYAGLRICRAGYCINKKCENQSWDPEIQRCGAESGTVQYCGCNSNADCNDPTPVCDTKKHECVAACGDKNADNIVPNWSFEEWDGAMPEYWSLHNNYNATGDVQKSSIGKVCDTSVKLINVTSDNARLESDRITMPTVSYTADNEPSLQLKCSFHYRGTGHINLGYRAWDADGKEVIKADEDRFNKDLSSTDWDYIEEVEKKINPPLNAASFQFLIGFHGTDNSGILIDGLECIMDNGICEGVECKDWEICSLSGKRDPSTGKYVGQCKPRDGFCSVTEDKPERGTCPENQKCDTTTHTCKMVDGTCLSNAECTDDAKPVCAKDEESGLNVCVAGDPCEKAKCPEWKECTLASRGACVLKEGMCVTSADCTKEKSACYGKTHTCVEPDTVYSVTKASECPIDRDYFNYLNYEDEDPKKPQLYESLVCPVNIVPNGSFEDWVEFSFTEKSEKHEIPDWWYAIDDFNNFVVAAYKYMTELKFDAVKPYTTSTYEGDTALQLIYTGKGGDNRLTSWGFKVPAGVWDCMYWVRGKGNVKVHTYSSQGDAKATEYVKYDTLEWTPASFSLKENASGARIIIYVSETDASKDHIQVDNFVCTSKGSII